MEHTAQQIAHRIKELAAEFAGWRIGRGGSGHWWAVRGNQLIRSLTAEDLRARLQELAAAPPQVRVAGTSGKLSGFDVMRERDPGISAMRT
jgi:hypothetical protein